MAALAFWAATGLSAYSQYAQGQQQKREAEANAVERQSEAAQADQIANEAQGAAQRQAGEERRRARIMTSRAQALASRCFRWWSNGPHGRKHHQRSGGRRFVPRHIGALSGRGTGPQGTDASCGQSIRGARIWSSWR